MVPLVWHQEQYDKADVYEKCAAAVAFDYIVFLM